MKAKDLGAGDFDRMFVEAMNMGSIEFYRMESHLHRTGQLDYPLLPTDCAVAIGKLDSFSCPNVSCDKYFSQSGARKIHVGAF